MFGHILGLGVIEFAFRDDEFCIVEVFLWELSEGFPDEGLEFARDGGRFATFCEPDVIFVVSGFGGSFTEGIELVFCLNERCCKNDAVDDDGSFVHGVISFCFYYKYTQLNMESQEKYM